MEKRIKCYGQVGRKEYCYKTNEKIYGNGLTATIHIEFIKSPSEKTMQPLSVVVNDGTAYGGIDYIFVCNTTTLEDLIEELMERAE